MRFSRSQRGYRAARKSRYSAILAVLIVLIGLFGFSVAGAAGPTSFIGRQTGLIIPRFVSLSASRANMRVGPGIQYLIKWVYVARGIPLEIIDEYGNWRRVRDSEGVTGWMFHTLLSSKRTGLIAPWQKQFASLRKRPSTEAPIIARLQPHVLVSLQQCDGAWCSVSVAKQLKGYISQSKTWGAYPRETFGSCFFCFDGMFRFVISAL